MNSKNLQASSLALCYQILHYDWKHVLTSDFSSCFALNIQERSFLLGKCVFIFALWKCQDFGLVRKMNNCSKSYRFTQQCLEFESQQCIKKLENDSLHFELPKWLILGEAVALRLFPLKGCTIYWSGTELCHFAKFSQLVFIGVKNFETGVLVQKFDQGSAN